MEEKKETRGRKPSGKKLKQVAFKIDEELYNNIEAIAQEKSGVSIHTFLKDNIKAFYDFSLNNKNNLRNTFFYYPSEGTTKQIKFLCENQVFSPLEINKKIENLVLYFFYNKALLKSAENLEKYITDMAVEPLEEKIENVVYDYESISDYYRILENLERSEEIIKLVTKNQEVELISFLKKIKKLKEMVEETEGKENQKFKEFEKTLSLFVKNHIFFENL